MVTSEQIKKLCPSTKPSLVSAIVDNWQTAEDAGINTPLRIAHFIAQIAHETGGFRSVEESLNYSSAARIRETWPSRFKTDADARPFVRKPKELAIKVYGGRMGNAPAPSTDGWDFRGGGMMQTTGRDGYEALGFADTPGALREPSIAFKTAVREWSKRGCNELADRDDVLGIRRLINGGTIGLQAVRVLLQKAKQIFVTVGDANPSSVTLIAVPGAKAPVTTPPAEDNLIASVQKLLRDKGYPEVGDADNDMGPRTRNAILAFEADNDLPLTGQVSDNLLAALVKAPVRENSAARTNATADDLKDKGVPTVQVGDQLQKVGKGLLGTMGIGAIGQGAIDFDGVKGKLDSIKGLYDTVISFSPWIIGAAIAGVTIFFGYKVIEAQVEAYRKGHSV